MQIPLLAMLIDALHGALEDRIVTEHKAENHQTGNLVTVAAISDMANTAAAKPTHSNAHRGFAPLRSCGSRRGCDAPSSPSWLATPRRRSSGPMATKRS